MLAMQHPSITLEPYPFADRAKISVHYAVSFVPTLHFCNIQKVLVIMPEFFLSISAQPIILFCHPGCMSASFTWDDWTDRIQAVKCNNITSVCFTISTGSTPGCVLSLVWLLFYTNFICSKLVPHKQPGIQCFKVVVDYHKTPEGYQPLIINNTEVWLINAFFTFFPSRKTNQQPDSRTVPAVWDHTCKQRLI